MSQQNIAQYETRKSFSLKIYFIATFLLMVLNFQFITLEKYLVTSLMDLMFTKLHCLLQTADMLERLKLDYYFSHIL
jgi:hypothetical protein